MIKFLKFSTYKKSKNHQKNSKTSRNTRQNHPTGHYPFTSPNTKLKGSLSIHSNLRKEENQQKRKLAKKIQFQVENNNITLSNKKPVVMLIKYISSSWFNEKKRKKKISQGSRRHFHSLSLLTLRTFIAWTLIKNQWIIIAFCMLKMI